MAELSADCGLLLRLEQSLARLEVGFGRLQQQHGQARARYALLDRAGSDILASLDALLKGTDEPRLHLQEPDLQPEPERPLALPLIVNGLTSTADAA